MYTSYLTRETFENEHDEKMTRKFSYNYQVLKRLFPEVYKLPESEIRSLVHSIYDNPKMGDELLDHLTDVINKKKPEWGEYLNPKPEEAEQSAQPVQDNPLQPVQPKPLNTNSGFEPYKPQKSAFGLGIANDVALNNSGKLRGLNNTSGFGQTKLPDFTKGMDLKHSDMVTGFGINEDKQKSMFGTGFQMPKLPKMPQFPKAPEPQMPEMPQMPEIPQALHIQPMQQYPQVQLAYSAYNNQSMPPLLQQIPVPQRSFFNDYLIPEFKQDLSDIAYGANRTLNGMTFGGLDYLGNKFGVDTQMNSYLNTFSPEQQALRQIAGEMAQYGGAGLVVNDFASYYPIGAEAFLRWNGRRNLINQLKRGKNFKSITLGNISDKSLNEINEIRQNLNVPKINSRRVSVPADRVEHIYERRIFDNNYTPKEAADTVYDALFNKNSEIYPTRYDTIQNMSSRHPQYRNDVFIGKIRDGENIFVKTGYKVKK